MEKIKHLTQNVESAFYLKLNNEDDHKNESLEYEDCSGSVLIYFEKPFWHLDKLFMLNYYIK